MIFNNIYRVDFNRVICLCFPIELRQSRHLAWLISLIAPLKIAYNEFVRYKDDAVYRVSHNASITLLQKMLNDKFDLNQRRIYIRNAVQKDLNRFYYWEAQKEFGFYPFGSVKKGFYYSPEFNPDAADFIVHIPVEYRSDNEDELNKYLIKVGGELNYYKLYAKKYKIEWIN